MNEPLSLASALVAGVLLGAIFFGGLWWTVRRSVSSPRVALWLFASMLLRTGMVLPGFYFVMQGDWQRLLAALLGFVLARVAAARLARVQPPDRAAAEADHAA